MTSQQVIKMMQAQSDQITSSIIKDLIKEDEPRKSRLKELYSIYSGEAKIKTRKFEDPNKINNTLSNDYPGDIVDGITGYMFGESIGYEIDKSKYDKSKYEKITKEFDAFKLRNNIDDLDNTTGEMMSIGGEAARLLYVDVEGKERLMSINPWEVIFIMDPTLDEVRFAMIYYTVDVKEGDNTKKRTKVEWYDNKNVTYYISVDSGDFIPDQTATKNPQPHLFDGVPVIRFINNNAMKGDFEKVLDLINAYDRVMSDTQNEVEEFRLAYFLFYGAEPTEEVMRAARKSGAFYFPEGTNGEFLIKDLSKAVEFLKEHKKTINDNIYKFAKAIDMTDENFSGGTMSGESRRWKLVALENRAKSKERKFIRALRYQFKILATAWAKKEVVLNYEDISYQFKRNLPVDLKYHSEVTTGFKGHISEKTRLSLLPFVEDAEAEIEQMQAEQTGIDFNSDDGVLDQIGGGVVDPQTQLDLNSVKIKSAMEIVRSYRAEEITYEDAINQLTIFFGMTDEQAKKLVKKEKAKKFNENIQN